MARVYEGGRPQAASPIWLIDPCRFRRFGSVSIWEYAVFCYLGLTIFTKVFIPKNGSLWRLKWKG